MIGAYLHSRWQPRLYSDYGSDSMAQYRYGVHVPVQVLGRFNTKNKGLPAHEASATAFRLSANRYKEIAVTMDDG